MSTIGFQPSDAKVRLWVFSDLQQSDPAHAEFCMHAGVEDFLSLRLPIDAVCYLGDSTEGTDLARLETMSDMQVRELGRVDAPIYYTMGNHEFDYHRNADPPGKLTIPIMDRIRGEKQWHVAPKVDDWMFRAEVNGLGLVFFTDHAAPDGSWWTTHGWPHTREKSGWHPYFPEVQAVQNGSYAEALACGTPTTLEGCVASSIKGRLGRLDKPFFTFSHYAFPGGNRDDEGPLPKSLLPLPKTCVAHFYGHSHCGDHVWGRHNLFRQISTVNESAVSQFDVASLEDRRGNTVRSAVVEWYGGHAYGVHFRDHLAHAWTKTYLQACDPSDAGA